jgi:hypothetical protein
MAADNYSDAHINSVIASYERQFRHDDWLRALRHLSVQAFSMCSFYYVDLDTAPPDEQQNS